LLERNVYCVRNVTNSFVGNCGRIGTYFAYLVDLLIFRFSGHFVQRSVLYQATPISWGLGVEIVGLATQGSSTLIYNHLGRLPR